MARRRDTTDQQDQASRLGWADDLTVATALFFALCGLGALILDAIHGTQAGRFAVISPYSLSVMRWLYAAGFCASLVAYVGYPRRLLLRMAVVALCAAYAVATLVTWFLWLRPPDWV